MPAHLSAAGVLVRHGQRIEPGTGKGGHAFGPLRSSKGLSQAFPLQTGPVRTFGGPREPSPASIFPRFLKLVFPVVLLLRRTASALDTGVR